MILLVLLAVKMVSVLGASVPGPRLGATSVRSQSDFHLPLDSRPDPAMEPDPAIELVSDAGERSTPRAVPPVGWRRTADGWQHVSTWSKSLSEVIPLGQRVLAQQNQEPLWARELMQSFRAIPPGCFAIGQLLCIVVLFAVHKSSKILKTRFFR